MADPLAATRVPDGEDLEGNPVKETGKTETSAPLSTRNRSPDRLSLMEMAPWPRLIAETEEEEEGDVDCWRMPGATAARRERFPEVEQS